MTDKQLKRNIKKLLIIFCITIVLIIIFASKILGSRKTELSIYTNGDTYNLQALGINKEEFEKYLSIFGNLVDKKYDEKQQALNMAINFVEDMYPSYEIQTDENGLKIYDSIVINKVIQDVTGAYIAENFADNENYTYNSEEKYYKQNSISNRIPYCIEIKDVFKKDEKLNVEYVLGIFTNEQIAAYMTGQEVEFEKFTVKAVIMENKDYEYSKYFISEIKIEK